MFTPRFHPASSHKERHLIGSAAPACQRRSTLQNKSVLHFIRNPCHRLLPEIQPTNPWRLQIVLPAEPAQARTLGFLLIHGKISMHALSVMVLQVADQGIMTRGQIDCQIHRVTRLNVLRFIDRINLILKD